MEDRASYAAGPEIAAKPGGGGRVDDNLSRHSTTFDEDGPRPVAIPRWAMIGAGAAAVVLLIMLIIWAILFTVAPISLSYVSPYDPADQIALLQARVGAFAALVQIVGGVVLIATVVSAFRTLQATEASLQLSRQQLRLSQEELRMNQEMTREQLRVSERGQVTERFTRAIDQLGARDGEGNKLLELRLGGIYALERIAKDSEEDYWPVMEILTAYIRQNAAWPASAAAPLTSPDPTDPGPFTTIRPADIQAVLTVLRRRPLRYGTGENQRLDLSQTDLRRADMGRPTYFGQTAPEGFEAHFEGANFHWAHLEQAFLAHAQLDDAILSVVQAEGASFIAASLRRADFEAANMRGAHFRRSCLQEALLFRTELQGANFEDADLQGADFRGANLGGAYLLGADLRGAKHLSQEQIDLAYTDQETKLPEGLRPSPRTAPREYQRLLEAIEQKQPDSQQDVE